MKISDETKYTVHTTQKYRRQLKKISKQGKDIEKLIIIIELRANKQKLASKYKDHALINNKNYKGCRECHIEPDWLLIYK